MRQLVTIQKILKLEPIENADQIEKATILGWHLVVRKGDFKEGDLCVFFEIDSLLPMIPEFEFLAKGNKPKKSFTEGKEKLKLARKLITPKEIEKRVPVFQSDGWEKRKSSIERKVKRQKARASVRKNLMKGRK